MIKSETTKLFVKGVIIFIVLDVIFAFLFGVLDKEMPQMILVKIILFFIVTSAIMLWGHNYIEKTKNEVLGFAFLGTLTLKMIASYLFFVYVIQGEVENNLLKIVFFVLFIEFLVLDTFLTMKLLNKKE